MSRTRETLPEAERRVDVSGSSLTLISVPQPTLVQAARWETNFPRRFGAGSPASVTISSVTKACTHSESAVYDRERIRLRLSSRKVRLKKHYGSCSLKVNRRYTNLDHLFYFYLITATVNKVPSCNGDTADSDVAVCWLTPSKTLKHHDRLGLLARAQPLGSTNADGKARNQHGDLSATFSETVKMPKYVQIKHLAASQALMCSLPRFDLTSLPQAAQPLQTFLPRSRCL